MREKSEGGLTFAHTIATHTALRGSQARGHPHAVGLACDHGNRQKRPIRRAEGDVSRCAGASMIAPIYSRSMALAALALALAGCTTSRTALADPDRSPATKADMKNYVLDSYSCVRESAQDIRLGQLPWSRERDAQRLYESCMTSRGYDVRGQDATR